MKPQPNFHAHDDAAMQRHLLRHTAVSDCPLVSGNAVTLLDSGAAAIATIFRTIAEARDHLHLEYYEVEDVHAEGTTAFDLLLRKLAEGVQVTLIYDAAGSNDTSDDLFDRLRQAGAHLLEIHPLNPLRPHLSWRINDRDHRKILLADGSRAVLGGVNLSRVYENRRAAEVPKNSKAAFWYDAAALIEGPIVGEIQKLFFHTWERHGGKPLPTRDFFPALHPSGGEVIRVDGSAPRERRQLYFESFHAAVQAAESHILLTTGYFVPTHRMWRLLAAAARRGVRVDLVLAGHSDIPACMHAARALYGRLMTAGVRIHELRDGVHHAKLATIDGVWSAIGSSNLDRRSYVYNNEIDAIVLGRDTAGRLEALLHGWIGHADTIDLKQWQQRSMHEHIGELMARVWSRYM